jgi:6-pyruvoyltetrahydropterin/6-carboxytetrahydropterin synthase
LDAIVGMVSATEGRRVCQTPAPHVRLERTYRFTAAHFYWDASRSAAENERLFGKCANRHGHGHDYRLEIVLQGSPDPATGMLFDLRELDRIVADAVLQHLDHRNINHEVEWFASRQPTCENLALFVWSVLAGQLPSGLLASTRVRETDDLAAEYRGA